MKQEIMTTIKKIDLLKKKFKAITVWPNGSASAMRGDWHEKYVNTEGGEVARFNNNTNKLNYNIQRISQLPDELKEEAIQNYLSIFPDDIKEEMKFFIDL